MLNNQNKYDLEDRTATFGEEVMKLCKITKIAIYTEPIIKQILRSSMSVGANYMEANGVCSKKDFSNKIYLCKKESQETRHWLRMLLTATDENHSQINLLLDEAIQLSMIFHKIGSSSKSSN